MSDKGLTIFDIDRTLFHSNAKVGVDKDGEVIKVLNDTEYNTYILQDGEKYDYSQFRSSKVFEATAKPIASMLAKAQAISENAIAKGSKVIIVTARSDMDDKELFVSFFEKHGLDMANIYIERAGNIGLPTAAENKTVVFRKYLDTGEFKRIRLFDDAIENLRAFVALKPEYPATAFEAYLVREDGNMETIG